MQAYKIRIPNSDISRQVQEKAFELGYHWMGYEHNLREYNESFLYLESNGYIEYGTSPVTFDGELNTEISYQDFLRLGEEPELLINNTIQPIMAEIKLKCIKQPQKAKNITEGREYTGIYVDGDDTQVDRIQDAEYFQCVNNGGTEAKYRISLFAPITPPVPPRPAKISMATAIERLLISEGDVAFEFNGGQITFDEFGLSSLDIAGVNCSCGIYSADGINELLETIVDSVQDKTEELNDAIEDFDKVVFIDTIFKAIITAEIARTSTAFVLFSTTQREIEVCRLMDEIMVEEDGSVSTGFELNPNSRNQIKAWLIKK